MEAANIFCPQTCPKRPARPIKRPAQEELSPRTGRDVKRFVLIAAAALAVAPTLAQAPTAETYHPGCAAVAEAKRWGDVPPEHQAAARACLGAVSVLLHTGKKSGICPPAPVGQPDAAAVVARHIDENPDLADEPFRAVARAALAEAFPCEELGRS